MSEDHGTSPAPAGLPPVHSRQDLAQRRMSQLGPVVIVVVTVLDLKSALSATHAPHRTAILVALGLFAVFGVLGLGTRRGAPSLVHVTGLIGLAAASVALSFLTKGLTGDFGLLMVMAASIPLLPLAAGATLTLASAAVVSVAQALNGASTVSAGATGLTFLGGYVIIVLSRRIRQSNDEAELMHRQAAALAERQRLAREMHDVLAHSLSGLMLQLEGARMLAAGNPADPRLPEIIERAHHLGKTGLDEARRAIGMLRDDDLPGPEQLATLAGQFERDSGIACHLTVTGQARELDSEARLALYRVAQEALTNIRKHACTDRVDIKLAYADGRTSLTVEDFTPDGASPGPAPASANSGGGYGLTGMRERAELLGGSLQAGPTGRGFRVQLEVPA